MTTILLVRHGETDWNRERRFQGHADPPLSERGREQALRLAVELADEPIDAVVSSDLRRAYQTARIVAEQSGLEVTVVPALREVDVGSWSGLTTDEVQHRFPDDFKRWAAYESPGWDDGETYEEVGERVVPALEAIASSYPQGTVVAVTHGGPIRAVLAHAAGVSHADQRRMDRVLDNCAMARIVVEPGSFRRVD